MTAYMQTFPGQKCPHCKMNWFMFPPVVIMDLTNVTLDGKRFQFAPTGRVRCVECKYDFLASDFHFELC